MSGLSSDILGAAKELPGVAREEIHADKTKEKIGNPDAFTAPR